jgi:sigma-E factor negative regulatory protein RseC
MIEQGTVVELRGDKAVVEMGQSGSCTHCRACACGADGRMRVEVSALPALAVGDHVEIDIPVGRLQAAVTVYVIPLGALLAGAILGNALGDAYWPGSRTPGLLAIVGALVFVVMAFVGIAVHERRASKTRPVPTIRRVE